MALIRKVDCVRLYVPDLEAGLAFYCDRLGHELIWRTATAAGLRLPESEAELVLQTEDQRQEVDLLVDSADEAARFIEQAGGRVIVPPFDIQIGRCAVVDGDRVALFGDVEGEVGAHHSKADEADIRSRHRKPSARH